MNRDRLVQLAALILAIACLLGTTALAPLIRQDREELQLTFEIDGDQGTAPSYVLAAAALGSFRGLAVNVLWYRAEQLKEQGKLHESNTLAEWITTLQPRFGQVWSYHAWNLAYNISVQTHTPEERWMWVRRGIELLRNRGIPNNPTVIRLYRELAWIFFHKISERMDDHHWYYKRELAHEWQELLGAPTEGATTQQAVAAFDPIAEMADRYFRLHRPSRRSIREVESLIDAHADAADALELLRSRHSSLDRFLARLDRAEEVLRQQHRYSLAQQLEPIREHERQRQARSRHPRLALLREEHPAAAAAIDAWHEQGLELDRRGLRAYGNMAMLSRYVSPQRLMEEEPDFLTSADLNVLRFMFDHGNNEGLRQLLAYLRAKVLIEDYHMQPGYMVELMEMFGPLDWRHPASHAVYWAALGVETAGRLRESTKFDVLNTDRNVVHGLQSLMFTGRISYDPMSGNIDMLPDPRFIDAYAAAMETALARYEQDESVEFIGDNRRTFESGHENFLHKAALFSYLYGSEEKARAYLDEARSRYRDRPYNVHYGTYDRTFHEFVLHLLQRDMRMMQVVRPFIEAMISRGLSEGLAMGRVDVFNRFHGLAQQMHTMYREQVGGAYTPTAMREDRLDIGSFDDLLVETYVNYMRSPGVDIYTRSRVYRNTPAVLRQRSYDRFRAVAHEHAQRMGLNPERAFPAPDDIADARPLEQRDVIEGLRGDTVERQ